MKRFLVSILLLTGLGALTYLMISLFLPSPRHLTFGINRSNGKVRMVKNSVTFLPPLQYRRIRFDRVDGYAVRDGVTWIDSREGVPIKLTYRLRFALDKDVLPDAQRLVTGGWSAWIDARLREAMQFVNTHIPVEEFTTPTLQFASRRQLLSDVAKRHLEASGLEVASFQLARIEVDREAMIDYKRAELRRKTRGAFGRVALFQWEGADWDLLKELVQDGRMPNLELLLKEGATADIESIQPTIAPVLEATVATGARPDRHGVIGFTTGGGDQPVDSRSRQVPALWDIAAAFGRPAMVVNWWTGWPPSSPHVHYFDSPGLLHTDAYYPSELSGIVQSQTITPSDIAFQDLRKFLNITESEFNEAVSGGASDHPIVLYRELLAKTWSDHRVALEAFKKHKPLLVMTSNGGTDAVGHLFSPYLHPYREGVDMGEFRKYWPAVFTYYAELDRLLGEWMNVLPKETTIIIFSSHGMQWGRQRPRQPAERGTSTLSEHRQRGIFVARGNRVKPARTSRVVPLYDLAPTVLALIGLPKGDDMPGNVMQWAFDIEPITSVRITSYADVLPERKPVPAPIPNGDPLVARLERIGHMVDEREASMARLPEGQEDAEAVLPSDVWGEYAYYNNLGVELKGKKQAAEALNALEKAISLNPSRPTPYLNLAMLNFDRQHFSAADEMLHQAVARGLPNGEKWYIDFAALYREANMPTRAAKLLEEARAIYPQSAAIAANLGSAMADVKRYTEGTAELERALGLQPTNTLALNNLGLIYLRKKDYARALDYWNRSLAINPQQSQIKQAASAVMTHL